MAPIDTNESFDQKTDLSSSVDSDESHERRFDLTEYRSREIIFDQVDRSQKAR